MENLYGLKTYDNFAVDFNLYLIKFRAIAEANDWSVGSQSKKLVALLGKEPFKLYCSQPEIVGMEPGEEKIKAIQELMLEAVECGEDRATCFDCFLDRKKLYSESWSEYVGNLEFLLKSSLPSLNTDDLTLMVKRRVLKELPYSVNCKLKEMDAVPLPIFVTRIESLIRGWKNLEVNKRN